MCNRSFPGPRRTALRSLPFRSTYWPIGAFCHVWKATVAYSQPRRHRKARFEGRYRCHSGRSGGSGIPSRSSTKVTGGRGQSLTQPAQIERKIQSIAAYNACHSHFWWHELHEPLRKPTITERERSPAYTSFGHLEPFQCHFSFGFHRLPRITQDRKTKSDGLAQPAQQESLRVISHGPWPACTQDQ